MMSNAEYAGWRKSSFSGNGNSCVEVAAAGHADDRAIGVRDTTQNGGGLLLEFSAAAWREFLGQIR